MNILKLFFAGVLALVLHGHLFAQEFYGGIKGGYVYSELSSNGSSEFDIQPRNTYAISSVLGYEPGQKIFGFTAELGYIMKGATFSQDSMDYKLHFINCPLLLDVILLETIKVSLGPEISFLTSARNQAGSSTSNDLLNIYDNRWEFSGTLGLSYSIDFYMDLGLRYNRAFSKLSSYDPLIRHSNLSTQYLQFFVLLKVVN